MAIRLLIIGGGAAGLMAAATAAEMKIPALLLERRHRLGLKLLMCGNNRCNVSHDYSAEQMMEAYGGEIGKFLGPSLEAFSPSSLRQWFQKLNLKTVVKRDDRIYPATEKADDVLHAFTDYLRDNKLPYVLNCPVQSIQKTEKGYAVLTENGLTFEAENILIATGGVSYPKTGSVGDGLKFASSLGLKTTPLRAGLAAVECSLPWLSQTDETDIPEVVVHLSDDHGCPIADVRGNLLCSPGVLRGSAIFDATRLAAHRGLTSFRLMLDLFPRGSVNLERLPREVAVGLKAAHLRDYHRIDVTDVSVRPLKEAIVTVGGVALTEIDCHTMQAVNAPGLYFAGETLDIDGPTGGFNLHAAFSTARLAVMSIAGRNPEKKNSLQGRHPAGTWRPDRETKRYGYSGHPADRKQAWPPAASKGKRRLSQW